MRTLYWLQAGSCGGDTMALLSAGALELQGLLALLDIELLWHPSFATATPRQRAALDDALLAGDRSLDVLCVEGAVVRGPDGAGRFDCVGDRPKLALLEGLAGRARHVVAVGTCAAYGGIPAAGSVDATGLQFHGEAPGGHLGAGFRAGDGRPVLNLPGCPCHPAIVVGAVSATLRGAPIDVDETGAPRAWYGTLVHQGCVRNEYHEYRVEETDFGQKGCMFFHMGCRAPMTRGVCNKLHWNGRSAKTAAGVPCFGCTSPDFPRPHPLHESRNIAGVPLDLPLGVDRAHYLAYKGMAAAAAPERLRRRETDV